MVWGEVEPRNMSYGDALLLVETAFDMTNKTTNYYRGFPSAVEGRSVVKREYACMHVPEAIVTALERAELEDPVAMAVAKKVFSETLTREKMKDCSRMVSDIKLKKWIRMKQEEERQLGKMWNDN